jgi:hypothetical protein
MRPINFYNSTSFRYIELQTFFVSKLREHFICITGKITTLNDVTFIIHYLRMYFSFKIVFCKVDYFSSNFI